MGGVGRVGWWCWFERDCAIGRDEARDDTLCAFGSEDECALDVEPDVFECGVNGDTGLFLCCAGGEGEEMLEVRGVGACIMIVLVDLGEGGVVFEGVDEGGVCRGDDVVRGFGEESGVE